MARTRHGRGSGCWCGVGVEMCRYGCVERGGCECVCGVELRVACRIVK